VAAFLAPNDQPNAGGGSIVERHRWAGFGFHDRFPSRINVPPLTEPLPPL
jgi:hypothetical protein